MQGPFPICHCHCHFLNLGKVLAYVKFCPHRLLAKRHSSVPYDLRMNASHPQESVVDTTGAGDAFVGSLLYGLATGTGIEAMLRLAAVVAACKCTKLGARPGLPYAVQLNDALLSTSVKLAGEN